MTGQLKAAQSRPAIQSDMLTHKEGSAYLGVSKPTFWRLAKTDPTFPPKIRLSANRVAWRLSALNAWLDSREGV